MGVNKVNFAGRTLIDISDATVTPETLAAGVTAYNAAGELITGTLVGLPVGAIFAYAGDTPPDGALSCDHGEISRATYANLFSVIGTKYGAGNGSTTFNLPNMNNGSFLEGAATAGTVKAAGLPNIQGDARLGTWAGASADGSPFYGVNTGRMTAYTDINHGAGNTLWFDASRSSPIYGNSNTVQPKAVTIKFCIKY